MRRRLRDYFRSLLDQLTSDYASDERGLEIREVAGGFRFATKPEYHDAVRGFVKSLKPAAEALCCRRPRNACRHRVQTAHHRA